VGPGSRPRLAALSGSQTKAPGFAEGYLLSLNTDRMATPCPPLDKVPQPENFLKMKGQERDFSSAKPENILKRNAVTINCRNPEKA